METKGIYTTREPEQIFDARLRIAIAWEKHDAIGRQIEHAEGFPRQALILKKQLAEAAAYLAQEKLSNLVRQWQASTIFCVMEDECNDYSYIQDTPIMEMAS